MHCKICNTPGLSDQVAKLVLAGQTDRAIGRQISVSKSAVNRHRLQHIIAVERHKLAILDRGAMARRKRAELAAAAASDNPSTEQQIEASFGLSEISKQIRTVDDRLERNAASAEDNGAYAAVAQVSGQQLRSAELKARIGGHLNPRGGGDEYGGGRPTYSITMVFQNAGRTEEFNVIDPRSGPTIDAAAEDGDQDDGG